MPSRPSATVLLMLSGLVVLTAAEAASVPPSAPFPAAVSPGVDVIPANGRVLVFGGDSVTLADVGFSASVDGTAVFPSLEIVGCCTVAVTFPEPLPLGGTLSLSVSGPGGDESYAWTVAPLDEIPPEVGSVQIVQVVSASRLVPPMTPREGPAYIVTLDVEGAEDDVGVAALASYDDEGRLVTLEPPSGQRYERMLTGVVGAGTEVCVFVEVLDNGGQRARSETVCAPVPSADDPPLTDAGCSAASATTTSLPLLFLGWMSAARRARGRRRTRPRRRSSPRVLLGASLLVTGCAPDTGSETRLCDDGFEDHTYPGAASDDAFFDAHAREQYGWRALKLLVVHLEEPERRAVGLYDDDFYPLHDQWFFFRLMNGAVACGAEEIAPVSGAGPFDTVADIITWARAQERLPPFLSWREERLTAPDFYRLSRDSEPRVYAPAYLTRDVEGEPGAYAVRVAGVDAILAHELAALFDALDPLMPAGSALYWKPSPQRESHQALADALEASADPLAARIRR